eukprot:3961103-Heterocapsa_arctica.AAC.1
MMIAADHEQTSATLTSELKVLGGVYLRLLLLEIAEAKGNFEESTGGTVGQTCALIHGIGMIIGMM